VTFVRDCLEVRDRITDSVPDDLGLHQVTQLISLSDPHSDRHLVDGGQWDLSRQGVTLLVGWRVLLEPLLDGALGVVKRRLDGGGLHYQPLIRLLAVTRDVRADLRDVPDLSFASLLVDIKVIVFENGSLIHRLVLLGESDAGGEGRKLEEAVGVEVFLVLGETVEHLRGAL